MARQCGVRIRKCNVVASDDLQQTPARMTLSRRCVLVTVFKASPALLDLFGSVYSVPGAPSAGPRAHMHFKPPTRQPTLA